MHVSFIHILLPRFLTDIIYNVLLIEVGNLSICLGTLSAFVRDDSWHLWVVEGCRCLGHDEWLTSIAVGFPKITIQLLYSPG